MQNWVFHIQSHHFSIFLQLKAIITVTGLRYLWFPLVQLLDFKAFNVFEESLTLIFHWFQIIKILEELRTVIVNDSAHFVVDLPGPYDVAQERWKVFEFSDFFFAWDWIDWLACSAFVFVLHSIKVVLNEFEGLFFLLGCVITNEFKVQEAAPVFHFLQDFDRFRFEFGQRKCVFLQVWKNLREFGLDVGQKDIFGLVPLLDQNRIETQRDSFTENLSEFFKINLKRHFFLDPVDLIKQQQNFLHIIDLIKVVLNPFSKRESFGPPVACSVFFKVLEPVSNYLFNCLDVLLSFSIDRRNESRKAQP